MTIHPQFPLRTVLFLCAASLLLPASEGVGKDGPTNGAKPAAVGSEPYFCPLSKKQFLGFQLNAIAYGLN